jgi:hypothetical protein
MSNIDIDRVNYLASLDPVQIFESEEIILEVLSEKFQSSIIECIARGEDSEEIWDLFGYISRNLFTYKRYRECCNLISRASNVSNFRKARPTTVSTLLRSYSFSSPLAGSPENYILDTEKLFFRLRDFDELDFQILASELRLVFFGLLEIGKSG